MRAVGLEPVLRSHREFGDDYMNLASQAQPVADWLTEQYNRLLEVARKVWP
jgi:hypothetical protein